MSSQVKLDKAKFQRNYLELVNFLRSTTFRAPIKKYIDDNCHKIDNKQESKHSDYQLHKEFVKQVESLLTIIKEQLNINDLEFVEFAKIGFEREGDKAFFEQVIACENFDWFKTCMIKRNIQLKEAALKLMYANSGDQSLTADSTLNKMKLEKEEAEIALAIAMSLAADDEKKKLYGGKDDDEILKAIEESKRQAEIIPKKEDKSIGITKQSQNDTVKEVTPIEKPVIKKEIIKDQLQTQTKPTSISDTIGNNEIEEDVINEKDSPKKYVKVSTLKPHLQRYTPSYTPSTSTDILKNSNSTLITEKDLKSNDIKKQI